jgi:cation diffusion facilitator family transporter
MVAESIQRMVEPHPIRFNEAIVVAVVGLIVNLVSAMLLKGHRHATNADSHEHHRDHNIMGAYLHVIADALTSLLAIVALTAGKMFGWIWMDPVMGVVGGGVILKWSHGLLKDTSGILLDRTVDPEHLDALRNALESDGETKVVDLHVWPVSSMHMAAIMVVISAHPKPPAYYKKRLAGRDGIVHVTVEVRHSDDAAGRHRADSL